jgi:hypothetical protein
MNKRLTIAISSLALLLTMVVTARSWQSRPLPNPVLVFQTVEFYSAGGKDFTRYRYAVDNFSAYPDEMFAAAPGLPPCGTNTNSSRTWVDLFDSRGKRLYGFCALGKAEDLNKIWFAVETEEVPPSYVYIELNDRQTNTKYKSNLADTVQ